MDYDNGRRSSEAYSSSSDFYSAADKTTPNNVSVPPARPSPTPQPPQPSIPALPQHREELATTTPDHHDADDEGSSDAMDLSTDSSNAGSPQPQHAHTLHAGSKRKATDIPSKNGSTIATDDGVAKKIKLSSLDSQDVDNGVRAFLGLPMELWQQVFLHLPPVMLGRCLSVCRTFNTYLTRIKPSSSGIKSKGSIPVKDSEAIWTQSRRNFYPNLPKPLSRCSELRMLQLVGGRTCQFCQRQLPRLHATDPYHCGPGLGGLRTVWPFAIRACGRCLENNTLKDIDVLKSNSSAKELRFGLPYIFLTAELHFIPASQRQQPGGIPVNLRASKVYHSRDIGRISAEFEEAKSLGDGAAEEWRKGLHAKGQAETNDASRWERWEATTPIGKDITQVLREYDVSSFPCTIPQWPSWSAGGFINGTQLPPADAIDGTSVTSYSTSSFQPGYQNGYTYGAQIPVASTAYQQPQRPIRDANQILAIREARLKDIERRCMELEPPLEPEVLQHCPAFQSAMQINQPMTDATWETVLRPRILAQREEAALLEHQRKERAAALNAGFCAPGDLDFTKSGKDLRDKQYDNAQHPLRKALGEYAKECIDAKWNGAHHLDKDNCTAFAVDLLLYVRQRYLQDKEAGNLPSVDLPNRTGTDQGTPIPDPFLSLDNMKWVFENEIRPLTENLRRELFICAECTDEKRPKWFAFEGLIQHYGAKHTSAFSRGNVVVQWENSEWPDEPPFHQRPMQFIVTDRKTHGRTRNTPQAGHHGPFTPPPSSRLLSENPLFSARGPHPPQLANGHRFQPALESPYQHGGHSLSVTGPAEPSIDMSESAQVNKLSNDAREIWDALEGVKELLDCVRLQASIHISVQRFWEKFRFVPSLDLLTDALAGNAQILPVKNASGLACRICVAERNPNYQSYYARIQNVKLYATSSLVTHFKLLHSSQAGLAQPNWPSQMVELPEQQMIGDLISAPGMDDDKLAILASAFPTAFPDPLPRIGLVQAPVQETGTGSGLPGRMLDRLNKKTKSQSKKKGTRGANGTSTPGRGSSSEPAPEPKEDEYDPRRPMYVASNDNMNDNDPARFDTDIRRARDVASTASSSAINLPPTSLVSLNNFSALQLQNQQAPSLDDGRDRSPSVGRTESRNSATRPTVSAPITQPDITAILASLMPQLQPMQTDTPPKSISNRSDSGPKYLTQDPYGQPHGVPTNAAHDDHRPVTRYSAQPSHRASVEYSPQYNDQHSHAAASRNIQSFQQNHVRNYVEPAYSPAHTSPHYRYVYEEGSSQHYTQPIQGAPIYREQPIQYIQLPAERSPPTAAPYHYERPRQPHAVRPVYVDAYGTPLELVPVDSAPAPIQYVPHPNEQQQQQQQRQYYTVPPSHASPPGSASRAAQPVYYDYGAPAQTAQQPRPHGSGHHHGMY